MKMWHTSSKVKDQARLGACTLRKVVEYYGQDEFRGVLITNSLSESNSSVLKQMTVLLSKSSSSSFRFRRVSWPNEDVTADSRSKQSKRSSNRSLHERKGDSIDWNTPVITESPFRSITMAGVRSSLH